MTELVIQILKALVAIPSLVATVDKIVTGVILWYVEKMNQETAKEIANAAAIASRATNKEERRKALDAWRSALSRPRISA